MRPFSKPKKAMLEMEFSASRATRGLSLGLISVVTPNVISNRTRYQRISNSSSIIR